MAELEAEIAEQVTKLDAQVAQQEQHNAVATAEFNRIKTTSDYEMELEKERVANFERKLAAFTPNLQTAIQTLGETETLNRLTAAVAPLAIIEQTSTSVVMERLFKGTPLETVMNNMKSRAATAK